VGHLSRKECLLELRQARGHGPEDTDSYPGYQELAAGAAILGTACAIWLTATMPPLIIPVMIRSACAISIAGLAGAFWTAKPAKACSYLGLQAHILDAQAQATDSVPPETPAVVVEPTKRGKGPETQGCGQSASSCDDLGKITLASGKLPDGLSLPAGDVRARSGSLYFIWIDGRTDDQEALSLFLSIRAVDLAGNVGPAVTVQINDPGSSSGCAVVPRRFGSAWPTATLAILLAACLWRRRARPGISDSPRT
jgi:hypothetical protein